MLWSAWIGVGFALHHRREICVLKERFLWLGRRVRALAMHESCALYWRLLIAMTLMTMAPFAESNDEKTLGAGNSPIYFDLRVQPLEDALAAFSELTGYSVLVSSSLTTGRQSAAVHGDFYPRDALQRLLADSGLLIRYVGTRAFTLLPTQTGAATRDGGVTGRRTNDAMEGLDRGNFAAGLQFSITRLLCTAQPDVFGRYRVGVQLWFGENGKVRDVRLLDSSGVKARDVAVLSALRGLAVESLPPHLPQPVTILLTPRQDPASDCLPFR